MWHLHCKSNSREKGHANSGMRFRFAKFIDLILTINAMNESSNTEHPQKSWARISIEFNWNQFERLIDLLSKWNKQLCVSSVVPSFH